MTNSSATEDRLELTYHGALEVFLGTDASYGGGLSNHGPMAAEALVALGQEHQIGAFVASYRTRLEDPVGVVDAAPADWRDWLRGVLPELVPHVASRAGHGLLRVAHAVRGLERAEKAGAVSPVQLRELAAAVDYWRAGGNGLAAPSRLDGVEPVEEWLGSLGRLPADERFDGMLTVTLQRAVAMPDYGARIAALAPSEDPASTLDLMATAAAAAFERNVAMNAFALLHGATVSAMAHVLLEHLDDDGARNLEAGVAGFVAAAVVGFDDPPLDEPRGGSASDGHLDATSLAASAAATLEDHTIKFAEACIATAARTGDDAPLEALRRQIETPYGL